jgi:hypothetical protein
MDGAGFTLIVKMTGVPAKHDADSAAATDMFAEIKLLKLLIAVNPVIEF